MNTRSRRRVFLLTPLREGRLLRCNRRIWGLSISTHAPAGGATFSSEVFQGKASDFYSRPCGRGDQGKSAGKFVASSISTHAPAGGATRRNRDDRGHGHISTHAPAGGATDCTRYIAFRREAISTHAPAGGATRGRPTLKRWQRNFYSRPCGRGDLNARDQVVARNISTHAPAGGATRILLHFIVEQQHFYSRPCGRGDGYCCILSSNSSISTHAPAGGATTIFRFPYISHTISTHAPAGGATGRIAVRPAESRYFYSRPCGRGDHLLSFVVVKFLFISTHAPAGGATEII